MTLVVPMLDYCSSVSICLHARVLWWRILRSTILNSWVVSSRLLKTSWLSSKAQTTGRRSVLSALLVKSITTLFRPLIARIGPFRMEMRSLKSLGASVSLLSMIFRRLVMVFASWHSMMQSNLTKRHLLKMAWKLLWARVQDSVSVI